MSGGKSKRNSPQSSSASTITSQDDVQRILEELANARKEIERLNEVRQKALDDVKQAQESLK
jgi:hypothetical protein